MEAGFSWTLMVLLALQSLCALLLLGPRVVSKPVVYVYKSSLSTAAAATAIYTVGFMLLALGAASAYELIRVSSSPSQFESQRGMLQAIDYQRSWLVAVLSGVNALLLFVNRQLAAEINANELLKVKFEALMKQVKGLQTEYNRVTTVQDKEAPTTGNSELDVLKKQVDRLIQDKNALQSIVDDASKARKTAEAKLEAMVTQAKGLENEYDRLLREHGDLQRKLGQYEPADKKRS